MKWRRVWQCKKCGIISRDMSSPEKCDRCSILVSETNCRSCIHYNDSELLGKSCSLSLFGFDTIKSCNDFQRRLSE